MTHASNITAYLPKERNSMNETEAWKYLATQFEKLLAFKDSNDWQWESDNTVTLNGLCFAVREMKYKGEIHESCSRNMEEKIEKELRIKSNSNSNILAPYGPEGARTRVKFCRRMLSELLANYDK